MEEHHGHGCSWTGCQLAAALSLQGNTHGVFVASLCLVMEDPDLTNVRAGFVLSSPKVPECRAVTGRGGGGLECRAAS